jgi:hypothetical protein
VRLIKHSFEQILSEFKKVHGDIYDYSNVKYLGKSVKVNIVCHKHGLFLQSPKSHLRGSGCPVCGVIKRKNSKKKPLDCFIHEAQKVHGDIYDYQKVNYVNAHHKIEILCKEHGVFQQSPNSHLHGQGCPVCGIANQTKFTRKSKEDFIYGARVIHGIDRYDYSQVDYINTDTEVTIICQKHGVFNQKPCNHLRGKGCPRCVNHSSKWELELLAFTSAKFPDTVGSYVGWYPNRPKKEIDIFIPSLRIGFECNGIYWHKDTEDIDRDKTSIARSMGIDLYILWENVPIAENKRLILYYATMKKDKPNAGK